MERRCADGGPLDIIDYPFEVSKEGGVATVKVGISGLFHDPADATGSKKLRSEERFQAASDYLRSRIERGECDPWNRPSTDCTIEVPSLVMDHWSEHGEIPHWI